MNQIGAKYEFTHFNETSELIWWKLDKDHTKRVAIAKANKDEKKL